MKRYVYMNERIRDRKPRGPVIVVQTGEALRNTNRVQLVHEGVVVAEVRFDAGGLKAAPRHHVRAFIEVAESAAVGIRFPRRRRA